MLSLVERRKMEKVSGRLPRSAVEIGRTGVKYSYGRIYEEFISKLKGTTGVKTFTEMDRNDPIIGAYMHAIKQLLREIRWTVNTSEGGNEKDTEFLKECMHQMDHSWDNFITNVLSMLTYGWSTFEQVYKRRDDGKIAWKKFAPRSQLSLERWDIDEFGDVQGLYQRPAPSYHLYYIPLPRLLHFRTESAGNNPEGRALTLDTPIPIPGGWSTMDEIQVGDGVFDEFGDVVEVIAVSQIMNNRPIFAMDFDMNETLKADAKHLWKVTTKGTRSYKGLRLLSTNDLIAGTIMYQGSQCNYGIPLTEPVHGKFESLPIDPYVLGYWLGDGHESDGRITTNDEEVVKLFHKIGFKIRHEKDYRYRVYGLRTLLNQNNLLYNKHVPEIYMRASEIQRMHLLQGLMDSDGSINELGHCFFFNTNLKLAESVVELVRSLGCRTQVTKWTEKQVHAEGHFGKKDIYRVAFKPAFEVFDLKRKLERQTFDPKFEYHYIKDIRSIEPEPVKCIQVNSTSGMFLVGKNFIPTHNSVLRNAFRPWYFKKHIEEFEAIGAERDLVGLPLLKLPEGMNIADTEDPEVVENVAIAKTLLRNIRRDEQEGILLPHGWEIELLKSPGERQLDTSQIINRYNKEIAVTVLAQFIMLGMERTGSYALAKEQTDMFYMCLEGWADTIASTINRGPVKLLGDLNNFTEPYPYITHTALRHYQLKDISTYVKDLVGVEALEVDNDLKEYLKNYARLEAFREIE